MVVQRPGSVMTSAHGRLTAMISIPTTGTKQSSRSRKLSAKDGGTIIRGYSNAATRGGTNSFSRDGASGNPQRPGRRRWPVRSYTFANYAVGNVTPNGGYHLASRFGTELPEVFPLGAFQYRRIEWLLDVCARYVQQRQSTRDRSMRRLARSSGFFCTDSRPWNRIGRTVQTARLNHLGSLCSTQASSNGIEAGDDEYLRADREE